MIAVQLSRSFNVDYQIGRASCRERVQITDVYGASRRRHTRWPRDWSSDVCSSDLNLRCMFLISPQPGACSVPNWDRQAPDGRLGRWCTLRSAVASPTEAVHK